MVCQGTCGHGQHDAIASGTRQRALLGACAHQNAGGSSQAKAAPAPKSWKQELQGTSEVLGARHCSLEIVIPSANVHQSTCSIFGSHQSLWDT